MKPFKEFLMENANTSYTCTIEIGYYNRAVTCNIYRTTNNTPLPEFKRKAEAAHLKFEAIGVSVDLY